MNGLPVKLIASPLMHRLDGGGMRDDPLERSLKNTSTLIFPKSNNQACALICSGTGYIGGTRAT